MSLDKNAKNSLASDLADSLRRESALEAKEQRLVSSWLDDPNAEALDGSDRDSMDDDFMPMTFDAVQDSKPLATSLTKANIQKKLTKARQHRRRRNGAGRADLHHQPSSVVLAEYVAQARSKAFQFDRGDIDEVKEDGHHAVIQDDMQEKCPLLPKAVKREEEPMHGRSWSKLVFPLNASGSSNTFTSLLNARGDGFQHSGSNQNLKEAADGQENDSSASLARSDSSISVSTATAGIRCPVCQWPHANGVHVMACIESFSHPMLPCPDEAYCDNGNEDHYAEFNHHTLAEAVAIQDDDSHFELENGSSVSAVEEPSMKGDAVETELPTKNLQVHRHKRKGPSDDLDSQPEQAITGLKRRPKQGHLGGFLNLPQELQEKRLTPAQVHARKRIEQRKKRREAMAKLRAREPEWLEDPEGEIGPPKPKGDGDMYVEAGNTDEKIAKTKDPRIMDVVTERLEKQQQPQTPRKCPFYKWIPATKFTVDAFMYGKVERCTHYFLSHFHSDHYGGLTKHFDHGKIVCNQVTANLVNSKLGVAWEKITVVPMRKGVEFPGGVEVVVVDANHCPGAAMFVFKLRDGRTYLHTGDFRANPFMHKWPSLRGIRFDGVFLDTTYCNPRYNFPDQREVLNFVQHIVAREERRVPGGRILYICGTYLIGKEKVFNAVADAISRPRRDIDGHVVEEGEHHTTDNTDSFAKDTGISNVLTKAIRRSSGDAPARPAKRFLDRTDDYLDLDTGRARIHCDRAKMRTLSLLQMPELLSRCSCDDPAGARVHVRPIFAAKSEFMHKLLREYRFRDPETGEVHPRFTQIVAFRPTGWTFSQSKPLSMIQPQINGNVRTYGVPYSEHSSYGELKAFIQFLRPHRIIPTVNVGSARSRALMEAEFRKWLGKSSDNDKE
eukprot:Clim_evm24s142 gene=Clim_evmTU24s142